MGLTTSLPLILSVLLVSIRLAPLFLFAPVFGSVRLPAHFRIFFVLAFSASLVAALNLADHLVSPFEMQGVLSAVLSELVVGAALATCVMIGFAAFSFGGRLLDLQMGFGVASLIDTNTRARTPLIGTALNMMAVAIFYITDCHHILLQAITYSFERIPLAQGIALLDLRFLFAFAGSMFSFGFALVAPVVLILFLIDVGLAFMSRTMPQMNVFAMGLALKVFVGMALLAISVRHMAGVTFRIFESLFAALEGVLP